MILATLAGPEDYLTILLFGLAWVVAMGMVVETIVRPRLAPWTKAASKLLIVWTSLRFGILVINELAWSEPDWPSVIGLGGLVMLFPGLVGSLALWRARKWRLNK